MVSRSILPRSPPASRSTCWNSSLNSHTRARNGCDGTGQRLRTHWGDNPHECRMKGVLMIKVAGRLSYGCVDVPLARSSPRSLYSWHDKSGCSHRDLETQEVLTAPQYTPATALGGPLWMREVCCHVLKIMQRECELQTCAKLAAPPAFIAPSFECPTSHAPL